MRGMEAVEHIRRDLADLKRRRALALTTYVGIIAVFFGILWIMPGPSLQRDLPWMIAFAALLAAALLGAAVTIGYPLVSRTTVHLLAGAVAVVCVGALLLVMDPTATTAANPVNEGMPCFVYGTGIAAIAMIVLGVISGRVWRRFPDPGFPLALGMTGVGLAALQLQCGHSAPLHLFAFHLAPVAVVYALAHYVVRRRNEIMQGG